MLEFLKQFREFELLEIPTFARYDTPNTHPVPGETQGSTVDCISASGNVSTPEGPQFLQAGLPTIRRLFSKLYKPLIWEEFYLNFAEEFLEGKAPT